MVQVTTPLTQVLNPVVGRGTPTGGISEAFFGGQKARGERTRLEEVQRAAEENRKLQKLSNLDQAATTGLSIIKRDPKNAESALRNMIAERKIVNPAIGITDTIDTDELETALNEGGVPGAQQLFQRVKDAAQSTGRLPAPTTPDFEQTFTAIGKSGKPEIFFRSDQGPVATNLLAPEKAPLVQIGAGGGVKERTAEFKTLFDESKNIDKTLSQFTQVKGIIKEGGLGTIGTSGKVTRGFEKAISAIGGVAKSFGLGSNEFDEGSIVSNALKGTPLGEQANRSAKINSLITNLGFAVARAQNPEGIITDKDFKAAIQTIGANADNPDQLTNVIDQFGNNLLGQFETDVERTGGAFGFTEGQFKSLRNIPSKKGFLGAQRPPQQDTRVPPITSSTLLQGITATTKPADLTPQQAQQLSRDNPDLLRKIIANARRGR